MSSVEQSPEPVEQMNLAGGSESRPRYSSAVVLANTALAVSILASIGWCIYCIIDQKSHLYVRLAPAVVWAAAALALLKFRPAARLIAISAFAGLGIGIY